MHHHFAKLRILSLRQTDGSSVCNWMSLPVAQLVLVSGMSILLHLMESSLRHTMVIPLIRGQYCPLRKTQSLTVCLCSFPKVTCHGRRTEILVTSNPGQLHGLQFTSVTDQAVLQRCIYKFKTTCYILREAMLYIVEGFPRLSTKAY